MSPLRRHAELSVDYTCRSFSGASGKPAAARAKSSHQQALRSGDATIAGHAPSPPWHTGLAYFRVIRPRATLQ